ncbi:MAG TPA: hypothetical protein PLN56_04015 [Methanoregulaceae archaeon]|nr:MAG: hypothetical protein IPI71_08280 [Methanolinea sp.]HON81247.1 hypothetical protein [Methanoregulaceae archaeon]HPD10147.1 hypothetical protein [Methanoregulaceae archaeon]HRT15153.1 hypothetical protein [Methanoregulaceae archaeon]HRU30730.1 hypothetical protein [Methanoregulaceae archaeon]
MRRDLLVIAAIILVVVVAIAIITFSSGPTLPDIHSVSTDKDLYHSNEVMMVSIEVTSSGTLDNTLLKIEGIEDRYGNYHVSREIEANLTPGTNPFSEEFRLPACSSCAGISAGTYFVNVTIEKDGVVMDAVSHQVQIAL